MYYIASTKFLGFGCETKSMALRYAKRWLKQGYRVFFEKVVKGESVLYKVLDSISDLDLL